jgi:1-acyl-sn-glycerol-3-phosphate acyltransferase
VRTAVAFALFGIGALLLAVVVFPLLRLLSGVPSHRELRAQYVIHLVFRFFTAFMESLGLIRLTVIGGERLRQGRSALVICNHPTLIDVVLVIAAMPQADCIVKPGVWRNPFLRGVVRSAGYVQNTSGLEVVDTCVARLTAGRWVLLFPEGTRSPRTGLGAFRRGAAHIAQQASVDIVPVVITCDPPMLTKGEPWFRVPPRAAQISLVVGARIRPPVPAAGQSAIRAARDWTARLRDFYTVSLEHARN